MGAFRGFGAPQSLFAIERHMDRAALAMGLPPEELRRRNFLRIGDTTATGQVLREEPGLEELLDRALTELDYGRKRQELEAANALSPRVKARMLTSYRYWDGPKGFESHLESWTELDSAVLGFFAKPFRGVLRRKQDQFIAYINGNVAAFGEFAEADPAEYRRALQGEGDLDALRDFERLFRRNGH